MSQEIKIFPDNRIGEKKKNKKLTFRVEDELLEEFKSLCKEKKIAQSTVLTHILKESIERLRHA
jgi:hypothetical protein